MKNIKLPILAAAFSVSMLGFFGCLQLSDVSVGGWVGCAVLAICAGASCFLGMRTVNENALQVHKTQEAALKEIQNAILSGNSARQEALNSCEIQLRSAAQENKCANEAFIGASERILTDVKAQISAMNTYAIEKMNDIDANYQNAVEAMKQEINTAFAAACVGISKENIQFAEKLNAGITRVLDEKIQGMQEILSKQNAQQLDRAEKNSKAAEGILTGIKEAVERQKTNSDAALRNEVKLIAGAKGVIEDSCTNQKNLLDDLNETLETHLKDLKKGLNGVLSNKLNEMLGLQAEQQQEVIALNAKIADITGEYKTLLNRIEQNGKALNELTQADIELLRKMMIKV